MAQTHELSQAAFDRLSAELTELTTHGRIDIARKIEEARALGDLSENGDHDVISPTSPLGERLLGSKVGEDVTYEVRGNELKVTVIEIRR